jgi:hypothetical protein
MDDPDVIIIFDTTLRDGEQAHDFVDRAFGDPIEIGALFRGIAP